MSRRLADGFLDALGAVDPDLQVDTLDVWAAELPEFDAAGIGVKYKRVSGEALSESEARVGAAVDALVERFRAADRIVVGVPMWNWSLPYKLKQLIDLVCQRGALFEFADGTYGPALSVPRGLVIGVRGQDHDAGFTGGRVSDADHHVGFVRFWLAAIGVARVETVLVDHTWDEHAAESEAAGLVALRALAAEF